MRSLHQTNRQLVNQMDQMTIQNAQVPRSTFHNRWTRKTAFDQGLLIPIMVDLCLPGDHMSYEFNAFLRMATPLFPMFDSLRVDTHVFFIPLRIVWENFVRFQGQQDTPGASIAFTIPRVPIGLGANDAVGSIWDHMNLPVAGQMGLGGHQVNALPLRAYNLTYNEWFRDENFAVAATFTKNDGPDTNSWYNLLRRAKSADYYTTALPQPQKFTAPTVPLAGLAPVTGIGKLNQVYSVNNQAVYETGTVGTVNYPLASPPIDATSVDARFYVKGDNGTLGYPQIYANLAAATGVDVNQLRQAFMVQSLQERDQRGGTRYIESVRSHWGIIIPDFRLQRPEYIGGGSSELNITPIPQTAPVAGVTPLGAVGGAATVSGTHRASISVVEHGYVLALMSVKSEISYQQGIERHWKYFTRFDLPWPELAGLGEQSVFSYEIYADGTAGDFNVFGYTERYNEFRMKMNEVTGIMRSTAASTIDAWHLAQRFASRPVLNQTFIEDTAPMTRILAAGAAANGQQFLANILYRRTATRILPAYGTPWQMGKF